MTVDLHELTDEEFIDWIDAQLERFHELNALWDDKENKTQEWKVLFPVNFFEYLQLVKSAK